MVTSVTLNAEEQHVSTTRVSSKQASAQPVLATSLGTSVQVHGDKDYNSIYSKDHYTPRVQKLSILIFDNQPQLMCGLLHGPLQENDCTSSCLLVNCSMTPKHKPILSMW